MLPPLLLVLAASPNVVRIAVPDLERAGVDVRHARVVQLALTQELRKLEGVSVIGADEVRAMLSFEADKQLIGCTDAGCLDELADALGVDELVVGTLAHTDAGESAFSLKRIRHREARVVRAFDRRFDAAGNGEELLVAIGPGVAALFPELSLKDGVARGVAKDMALRLNPPPLPTWVFATGLTATSALLVGAVATGAMNAAALGELASYKRGTIDSDVAEAKADQADRLAYLSYGLMGAATAGAIASAVAAAFTDFGGYAAMNEQASR